MSSNIDTNSPDVTLSDNNVFDYLKMDFYGCCFRDFFKIQEGVLTYFEEESKEYFLWEINNK